MASFDFVDVAAKGYERAWGQRSYLLRMAFPVLFTKVACMLAVVLMQVHEHVLRKELFLMPAYFVEAVFLSGLVRFIAYKEPIAMIGSYAKPKPDDERPLGVPQGPWSPAQCLQAGIVFFLLFRVVAALWQWVDASLQSLHTPEAAGNFQPTTVNAMIVLIALGALVWFMLWLVKFMWMFAAAAQGYSFADYRRAVREIKIPLFMVATMMLCFVPFGVLFSNIKLGAMAVFAQQKALQILSVSVLDALDETLIMTISTIAMTYAIHALFHPPKDSRT